MRIPSSAAVLTAALLTSALVAPAVVQAAPAAVAAASPGAPGAGDPYFPLSGNGGFDVGHYDLELAYSPTSGRLAGLATVTATATQALSRFDLDLNGLTVSAVVVNGRAATFRRSGQELMITPKAPLTKGSSFSVAVVYSGVPQFATDPDGSEDGWIRTDTGAFVAGEPQGAMTWFPASSHPIDKASFDITVTVPTGYVAVSNGELVDTLKTSASTTMHWRERQPMAAYLATATIGKFQVATGHAGKLPVYVAVDPREAAAAAPVLKQIPKIIAWEQQIFGPYPFSSTGAIVAHAHEVGYALETQTKPLFDRAPDTTTLVHELSHQWFGDSVSLTTWQDIWLNEGFATYAEWLYAEQHGGQTAQQAFDALYHRPDTSSLWARPVADPGSGAFIFSSTVYDRGAMVLEKLRQAVGYPTFVKILQTWAADHRYGHGTTAQFVALSEQLSGRDLTALYRTWLFTAGKPATP